MSKENLDEAVSVWSNYVGGMGDWQDLVRGVVPKDTPCGPIYDVIPNPSGVGERPNEGLAISDMRGVEIALPHYHTGGESEIYIVIEGKGTTYVGRDTKYDLEPGVVVVTPPETAHYTIPLGGLVLAVVNTPPFNPANAVDLHETNLAVGFDLAQYEARVAAACRTT